MQATKWRFTYSVGVCLVAFAMLAYCPVRGKSVESVNMVDERFELLSLVFRLAEREEYCDLLTDYQKGLAAEFGGYREHSAVEYAAALPLGYDAVFKFSVHIVKEGEDFVFIQDIDSLVEDGRWTPESAVDFLALLNDFYAETGFAEFYHSNIDFYEAVTQDFIDKTFSALDLEWFGDYVDTANLRCIYSPSSSLCNYGATVNDTIVYCAVSSDGSALVHEFCHSFANPIAHKWYDENAEFKKWCDETIDPVRLPNYTTGKIIAGEYVTRAYNSLYYIEHGYAPLMVLAAEKGNGFPYIEEVYALIAPNEKAEPDVDKGDKIECILGVKYGMGTEQSTKIGSRTLRWRVLTPAEPVLYLHRQTEVGNAFGSKTGDILYVEDTNEDNPFLLIDLGETTFRGSGGYRSYFRFPIEL